MARSAVWSFGYLLLLMAGCVLSADPAWSQTDAELIALNERVMQLHKAGKTAEAIPLAAQFADLTKRRFGESHPTHATALSNLAFFHHTQRRFAEAEPLYKRALSIREKALPAGHPEIVGNVKNLAALYDAQGRLAEAEPFHKRSLELAEKTLPAGHPDIAASLNNLAGLYQMRGRLAEAEPLFKRALEITEKALPADHLDIARSANSLGGLYHAQGRLALAEPLYKRALEIRVKALPAGHLDIAQTVNNLAGVYQAQGRLAEAEPLFRRALEIRERGLPAGHPLIARSLSNLALLYNAQGRLSEAEPLFKRALEVWEKTLPAGHPDIATGLNNLAGLYDVQGRLAEAEPLHKRALEMREKTLPPGHPDIAISLHNLAIVYRERGKLDAAESLYKRALELREKALPANHPDIAKTLNGLAVLYDQQGRFSDAEPLFKRALSVREKSLPADHPEIATSLNNLATLYNAQGRFGEAEPLFKRALEVWERTLPAGHPDIATSLGNLSLFYAAQKDWSKALAYQRRATAILIRRGTVSEARSKGGGRSEIGRNVNYFSGHVLAAHRVGATDPSLANEAFEMAQWALRTEAAAALAQMAARQAKGTGDLARLVRERQDLEGQWQLVDRRLSQSLGRADAKLMEVTRKEIVDLDTRLAAIDAALAEKFPDYAALAAPKPASIAATQALLAPDEVLLQIVTTPRLRRIAPEAFAWLIAKSDVRWVKLEAGPDAIAEHVQALRCGLDRAAWEGEGASRCSRRFEQVVSPADLDAGRPLPFDLARAHALYQALFGQFGEMIRGKHLLIVPSGALTTLPLQALVTERPAVAIPSEAADYAGAAWLAKHHAITVLPSVASLTALRQFAKASRATRAFIGFGNPLLTGPDGSDNRAWQRQSCAETAPTGGRVASRSVRGTIPKFFRSGLADVEEVRAQHPLPETAEELCAVARSAGAPVSDIYLGERATEKVVKGLSGNGGLARARVVHFATHGLLAGETEMLAAAKAEPALILTPPAQATEEDDGLLTASEVSQLKLDADWVVLSACNTAAAGSDGLGAEALSGLARAFFYAGARALLVSHWAVESDATVKLVTKTFDDIKADPGVGRSEALRRSMLALIESGGRNAHPASWAPFVVVGEGRR